MPEGLKLATKTGHILYHSTLIAGVDYIPPKASKTNVKRRSTKRQPFIDEVSDTEDEPMNEEVYDTETSPANKTRAARKIRTMIGNCTIKKTMMSAAINRKTKLPTTTTPKA
jgi:hypothetical protein